MKRMIAVVVVLLSTVSAHSFTFEELLSMIRTDLLDAGPSASRYWDDEELVRRMNMVQNIIVSHTAALKSREAQTPVAEQMEYDLPSDIIGNPLHVFYGVYGTTESYRKLSLNTISGLHVGSPIWESRTGTPSEYYIRAGKVGIVPAPTSSIVSTDTLRIDYVILPVQVSTSTLSLVPFNGEASLYPYHYLIIEGVMASCKGNWNNFWTLTGYMRDRIDDKSDSYIGEKLF